MIVKSSALAILLFFGSLGVAAAQKAGEPVPLGGSYMQSGANGTESPVTQAIVIGFNYAHAYYCVGSGGFYYFIALEGTVWFTTDTTALIGLAPACQTGNLVAFRVINSSGTWDQVYVHPFK